METHLPNLHCWGVPAVNFQGFLRDVVSTVSTFRVKPAIFHGWVKKTQLWVPLTSDGSKQQTLCLTRTSGYDLGGFSGGPNQVVGWFLEVSVGINSFLPQFPGVGRFYVTHFKKDSRGKFRWVLPKKKKF